MAVLSIDVGRKNLALCLLRPGACPRGTQDVIVEWLVTSCEPSAAGIARALGALPWALDCEEMVVERQPNRNATMTRLQHYLEMYFALHGKPVTVQDAKHKLAFAASTPWWDGDEATNWSYHTRKKLSVATTRRFLGGTPQEPRFVDLFAGGGARAKLDDYGDSLLQGMAFCHNVRALEAAKRAMAAAPAPVRARRPTAAQAATGRYSKPNVSYFLKGCKTREDVHAALAKHPNRHLQRAVDRHYGGADAPALLAALGS
jgi:hypothetical protein